MTCQLVEQLFRFFWRLTSVFVTTIRNRRNATFQENQSLIPASDHCHTSDKTIFQLGQGRPYFFISSKRVSLPLTNLFKIFD
jgi:hypothetical protein